MKQLRMRLARRIAPVPIMADPFRADGVFIYYRGKTGPHKLEWVMLAERFRLKSTSQVRPLEYVPGEEFRPRRPFTRFVGTVGG